MYIENISANVIDIIKSVRNTKFRVVNAYTNGKIDIMIWGNPAEMDTLRKKIWG